MIEDKKFNFGVLAISRTFTLSAPRAKHKYPHVVLVLGWWAQLCLSQVFIDIKWTSISSVSFLEIKEINMNVFSCGLYLPKQQNVITLTTILFSDEMTRIQQIIYLLKLATYYQLEILKLFHYTNTFFRHRLIQIELEISFWSEKGLNCNLFYRITNKYLVWTWVEHIFEAFIWRL